MCRPKSSRHSARWRGPWVFNKWRAGRLCARVITPARWWGMDRPVLMPDLGTPATLSVWFVSPGEAVYAGDRLVEVLVGGATFDVPSPVSGRLTEKRAWPDDALMPGQVLGIIEEDD